MKWFAWLVLLAAAVPALAAQQPADTSEDAEVQQLQRQLRQRWNERVRQDLNLSDEHAAKLQGTGGQHQQQRRGRRSPFSTLSAASRAFTITCTVGLRYRRSNPRQCASDQPITNAI